MIRLFYRGHETREAAAAPQSLAEQMRKPVLVYRGVVHDGTCPLAPEPRERNLVYRGQRFA